MEILSYIVSSMQYRCFLFVIIFFSFAVVVTSFHQKKYIYQTTIFQQGKRNGGINEVK